MGGQLLTVNVISRHFGLNKANRARFLKPLSRNISCRAMAISVQKHKIDHSLDKRKGTSVWNSDLSVCNMYITEDSTPYAVKVMHPGLLPEINSRKGSPQIWSILSAASTARAFAMHKPVPGSSCCFMEYDRLTADCFTFIASSHVTIAPAMYDVNIPKWPLQLEVKMGHIGRTSLSTVSSMTLPKNSEKGQIFHQTNQVVLVDKVNRRPIPIPDYWQDHYKQHCINGKPLIVKQEVLPSGVVPYIYEMKVVWSDTDLYDHTNFSSYPRFAINGIHAALRDGHLDGYLTKEDVEAGVAELKVAYLGESVEDDALQMKIWKLPEDRTFVCSVEKNSQVINQVTLTFHEPSFTK